MAYSPPAVTLSTESEPHNDSSPTPLVTSEDQSAVLNDWYSCIMYRGYLPWFTETFLDAEPALKLRCLCPTPQKTTPEEQKTRVQKTRRTLPSIGTEGAEISFLQLLERCCVHPRAAARPFYSRQLPFDDPWPLKASEQPLWSSKHITGAAIKKTFSQGHCPFEILTFWKCKNLWTAKAQNTQGHV